MDFSCVSAAFDRYIPSWREDNYSLRGALGLPAEDVWSAHLIAKHELFEEVRKKTGLNFDAEISRSGSHAAPPDTSAPTSFSPISTGFDRLQERGAFQIIYAGKAHPNDGGGKDIIRHIFQAKKALRKTVLRFFLDNYDLDLGGKSLPAWISGSTRRNSLEASGTSGMKAALNGVPS